MWVKETLAIAGKELRTEWRSRVALASLGLFVACSIALVALSTARIPLNGEGGKEIGSQIAAALIWIQVCFASAMGLGRAFVVESERGTMTALRLHTRATAVWAGKFIGNTLLLLGVCVITVPMTCGVLGVTVKHPFALIAVVILAAGGGHNTLNVGSESADFVSYFYNFGINTVILRNRLRKDGYVAEVDAVNDALQGIRMVRAYAKEWNLDPNKIGIMGFSAGAELSAPAAVLYDEFDKKNSADVDPLKGVSSRPDFVGIVYPGPTPFARNRTAPPIPKNVPPAFIACPGSGDRVHAIWAMEYYNAMLMAAVPNIEMHLYGNGRHGGALLDRGDTPLGTWQLRFIDWFRDLGFLQKPGVETKAAKDVADFVANPPKFPMRPAAAPVKP